MDESRGLQMSHWAKLLNLVNGHGMVLHACRARMLIMPGLPDSAPGLDEAEIAKLEPSLSWD